MSREVAGTVNGIALVIRRLNTGGAQRVLTIVANSLVQRDRNVYVITYSDAGKDFFRFDQRVHRIVLANGKQSSSVFGKLFGNVFRILALRQILKDLDVSVVVGFITKTNVLLILASAGLKIRTIISERNDPARQSFGWIWDFLRRLLYKKADLVTANSCGALYTMQAYVPDHKLAQVLNPIVWPKGISTEKEFRGVILNVGRLAHQKAHDILIEAFAIVAAKYAECRLVIIGEGELENDLYKQANEFGVADLIDWYSCVQDPFDYYCKSDIFILPSRYEGVSNSLLEAMSCGLPVIVSDASPGPLEYVEHEVSGLVVPVDNSERLADAIELLFTDSELRRRLGEEGRRRVSRCSVENVMEIWEQLLDTFSSEQKMGLHT